MKKNIMAAGLATIIASTALYADVEDDIFRSGVEKTLEVMKYQKKLSLEQKDWSGKFCYLLSPKSGEVKISDFEVVKLEALSLIAETKPLYFENKKGQKSLCFFVTDTSEGYNEAKKRIEEKFEDILKFSPKKVKLGKKDGITPIVPALGKWNSDMSDTISILNSKVSDLKEQTASCNTSLAKVLNAVSGIPATVNKVVEEIKHSAETKNKEQSASKEAKEKEIVPIPSSHSQKKEKNKTDASKKKKMLI